MPQIRLETFVPILILLLCVASCDRFNSALDSGPKPTQVVDLPLMIGKSRDEITKIVGIPPYKDGILGPEWELPEGTLTVFKSGETHFISYSLKKSFSGFASPGEMAKFVSIDVQSRKADEQRGLYSYRDISVGGRTFDVAIDKGSRYRDARVSNFRTSGGVTEGFKPTQVVDLPQMIGKSPQDITKTVGPPPWKEDGSGFHWDLPEGDLSVLKSANFISYNLKSYSDFAPDRGVASPGEMAALVSIDLQGRSPEKIRDGVIAYRNLSVNDKTLDLYIRTSDTRYMGVWIENFK